MLDGDRLAERDERARPVADRIAHHLGQLAAERPLRPLHALPRQHVILEDQVVGDGRRQDHQVRMLGLQRRVHQAGLRRLDLAAVAAAAFRVEEEVVLAQQLRDVGLQRHQVGRVLGVAADRNRAGDVAMQQAERTAEQVDARRR